MEQYISKSTVIAEIEKRISLFQKEKKTEKWSAGASQMNVVSLGARIAMLEEILSFLNTLEVKEVKEEPVSEELEEEIHRYYVDWDEHPLYVQTARHFAKWQKEHLIDKACNFIYEQLNNGIMECGDIETFINNFKKAMEK